MKVSNARFSPLCGVPDEVLIDNARALVAEHDAQTRTVVFNPKLLAFTRGALACISHKEQAHRRANQRKFFRHKGFS